MPDGAASFSRLLKWLLAKWHDTTMAMLCGFMIGSLYKLWPFQQEVGFAEKFKHKQFENVMPESLNSGVISAVVVCVAGFAVVMALEWFAESRQRRTHHDGPAAITDT
ncbi:MAG: DUF368 domain-containing protein [Planctomycetaceae bacterium]